MSIDEPTPVESLKRPWLPVATTELDRAFPSKIAALMPQWEDIPSDFRRGKTRWNKMAARWFATGVPPTALFRPKRGIHAERAFWHLHCVQASFAPSHEYKQATVAWLASRWFRFVYFDPEHAWREED